MPKPKFDLDGAVQSEVEKLISSMRARRLRGEMPKPDEKLNDETEKSTDADDEQAALEEMLET